MSLWGKNNSVEAELGNIVAEYIDELNAYYNKRYREASLGKMIITDKQWVLGYMIEQEKERQLLRLWKSHVITVMTSEEYSQESKDRLYYAWYLRLAKEHTLIEAIEYGIDPDQFGREAGEAYQDFMATLEAFNFNPEKEEKDTEKRVAKWVREQYKNVSFKKKDKKASKLQDDTDKIIDLETIIKKVKADD